MLVGYLDLLNPNCSGAFISSLSVPLIFYKFKALKTREFVGKFKNTYSSLLILESTIITGERLSIFTYFKYVFYL